MLYDTDNEISDDGNEDWSAKGTRKCQSGSKRPRYENDSANNSGYEPSSSDTPSTDSHRSGRNSKKWLSDYPWLHYNELKDFMSCSTCRRHKKNNQYASGTNNFRHTNILRHIKSLDHRAAQKLRAVDQKR